MIEDLMKKIACLLDLVDKKEKKIFLLKDRYDTLYSFIVKKGLQLEYCSYLSNIVKKELESYVK